MARNVSYGIPLREMWKMYKRWCKDNKTTDGELFYNYLCRLAYTDPNAAIKASVDFPRYMATGTLFNSFAIIAEATPYALFLKSE